MPRRQTLAVLPRAACALAPTRRRCSNARLPAPSTRGTQTRTHQHSFNKCISSSFFLVRRRPGRGVREGRLTRHSPLRAENTKDALRRALFAQCIHSLTPLPGSCDLGRPWPGRSGLGGVSGRRVALGLCAATMAQQAAAAADANVLLAVQVRRGTVPRTFLCPSTEMVSAVVRAAYRDVVRSVRMSPRRAAA